MRTDARDGDSFGNALYQFNIEARSMRVVMSELC